MYRKGVSSVFLINVHIVLVVKYRKKVISEKVFNDIKTNILKNSALKDCEVLDINYDPTMPDHIHVVASLHPSVSVASYVATLKIGSAKMAKKLNPEIRAQLWQDTFWSKSYFAASFGELNESDILNYIASQGEPVKLNQRRNDKGQLIPANKEI